MPLMKKFIKGLNFPFLRISMILILLMMFVTVADVAGRYFFELTRFGLGAIVCTALGFSQINKVHIAINLLVSRLPQGWQNIIETFNYLVAFVTFVIVSWQMFVYTGRLYASAQVTSVLGVSIYPFVLISALGVVLFTLVLFWDLVRAIRKLYIRGVEDEYSTHWGS